LVRGRTAGRRGADCAHGWVGSREHTVKFHHKRSTTSGGKQNSTQGRLRGLRGSMSQVRHTSHQEGRSGRERVRCVLVSLVVSQCLSRKLQIAVHWIRIHAKRRERGKGGRCGGRKWGDWAVCQLAIQREGQLGPGPEVDEVSPRHRAVRVVTRRMHRRQERPSEVLPRW
jgi:hypothetical protein